MMPGDLKEEFF